VSCRISTKTAFTGCSCFIEIYPFLLDVDFIIPYQTNWRRSFDERDHVLVDTHFCDDRGRGVGRSCELFLEPEERSRREQYRKEHHSRNRRGTSRPALSQYDFKQSHRDDSRQFNNPSRPVQDISFCGFLLDSGDLVQAFIKTLSDRVLREAQEAKKVARSAEQKASAAQSAIAPIVDREIEEDDSVTPGSSGLVVPTATISDKERRLLDKLAHGRLFRTRTGLAKETGLMKPDVDQMMDELKQRGPVDTKLLTGTGGEKKKRWYITNKGREAITSTSDLELDSPL
jgi:hypothetical protein